MSPSSDEESSDDAVDPHSEEEAIAKDGPSESKGHPSSWLSHILPHLSIPFPSVPALSAHNIFPHRGETNDRQKAAQQKIDSAAQKKRRYTASRQASLSSQRQMNHLELSKTTSTYPESIKFRGKMPNTRLQAVRDSFPTPSLPKLPSQRTRDPFDCLTGQDVVILGGYRGSILRDAKTRKRLWVPLVRAGLNLRKVDLAIPLADGADEHTEDTVIPDGILSKMGPIDFSDKLIRKLKTLQKQGKCRVHVFGYDWRVSPRLSSTRLIRFLESLPCNSAITKAPDFGALVIAHSMGGLIAHHALQQRPELFYGTVYCGTPFQHCVNILGPFKRGDALLRNREILSTSVNFSMRSSFIFLPFSGECFVDRKTHEKYPIDFFNYETWLEYGLSPCVSDVGEPKPPTNNKRQKSPVREAKEELADTDAGKAVPHPRKILEPHMQEPPPEGARSPKLKHDREEAIDYLKRTLEETKKFKQELEIRPSQTPLIHPPMAVVYAVNTPTVRGALVDGRDGIKTGNWWDFTYGPGDGVVLAKSAQLPEGFASVIKVKSNRGHIQLLSDLTAVGTAIEGVVQAKLAREM